MSVEASNLTFKYYLWPLELQYTFCSEYLSINAYISLGNVTFSFKIVFTLEMRLRSHSASLKTGNFAKSLPVLSKKLTQIFS